MERLNNYFAKIVVRQLKKYNNYTKVQQVKIEYSIVVLLGEIEKFVGLFVIFCLLGKVREFSFVVFLLFSTKHFVGGIHMKSISGCFLVSIIMIYIIIYLGNVRVISIGQLVEIYIYSLTIDIMCVPLSSKNHIITNREERKRLAILIITIVCMTLGMVEELRGYIGWTLLLTHTEVIIGAIIYQLQKKRGEINEKKECN